MTIADTPLNLEGLAPIVGLRIRETRTDRAMSQKDLVGERFSKSYISSIERGKITPSLKALEYIARQLNVSVAYLLTGIHPGQHQAAATQANEDSAESDSPVRWDLLLTEARLLREQGRLDQARHLLSAKVRVRQLNTEQLKHYHFTQAQLLLDSDEIASAQAELDSVRELADKTGDQETLARVRQLAGQIAVRLGRPVQAIEQLRLALQAVESGSMRDYQFRLAVYSQLGELHYQLGDDNEAAEMYRQALELAEEMVHPARLAVLYWNQAQAYRETGNLAQAKVYANKSLALYESLADRRTLTNLRSGYGTILLGAHQFEAAEQQFLQARQLAEENGDRLARTVAAMHLADLYLEQQDLDMARRYSQEMQEGLGDLEAGLRAQALGSQANLLAAQGDNRAALDLYRQAVELAEASPAKELLSKIYFCYARALSASGDTARAAEMFERAYRQLDRSSLVAER